MERKKIFVFMVSCYVLLFSSWNYVFTPMLSFGSLFQSRLEHKTNYERSKLPVYAIKNRSKRCFHISTLEQKSINCDFVKYKVSSDIENRCVENTNVHQMNNSSHNHTECTRFITIEAYKGRLGNQMFEVASLIGIAFTYDFLPVIPLKTSLTKYFNLPDFFANNSLLNLKRLVCSTSLKVCNISNQMQREKGNVSLSGHFQSWKYFYNISDIIKDVFTFKKKHTERAKQYLLSVLKDNFVSVCFHIRRGDVIREQRLRKGYVIPDESFYEKAKQFYLKNIGLAQFIIVSEDKEWCRKTFPNISISNFTNPGDDLALLSLCDHVVVTLGTFGWWGAWLSGGTTVYFDGFPRKGSVLESLMEKADYYPQSWIGIS